MSGQAAVLVVVAVLAVCGSGALAVIGVARSFSELARFAPVAPLAGMAWVGIVAATAATLSLPFGIPGLVVVTAATCAAGVVRRRRRVEPDRVSTPSAPRVRRRIEFVLAVAGGIVLAVVSLFALATYRLKPLVEYDGWAMWGMKSKAIAWLDGDADVLGSEAYERLHLEYPLLAPALHALPIDTAGAFSSNIVVLNCVLLGLAGLLAIWGLLRDVVRPALLLPALAMVAAMPAFFYQLGSGYADVPVAVVVAGGLTAAARWLLDGRTGWLAIATLFLAGGALIKNEGLLMAVCVLLPLLVLAGGRRRPVVLAVAAVALVYLPWRIHVATYDAGSPAYDLSASFDPSWVGPRLRLAPDAVSGILEGAFDPREVGFALALPLAACVLSLWAGDRRLGFFAAAFALLSLAGLSWIYLIADFELSSLVSSSAHRVVMSSVIGLATLYPLLIEESARALAARGDPSR